MILFIFLGLLTISSASPIDYINSYRAKHGSPPLIYNTSMDSKTESWAQTMSSLGVLIHSIPNGEYGENLGQTNVGGWESIVDAWYNEISQYNFSNPGFTPATGHFTQLVWVGSKSMSIGTSSDASGNLYVVARFSPPGNVLGQFATNVMPLLTKTRYICKCEC